jgi:hypothetical protein
MYKNPGQWYEMLQIIPQEIFVSSFFLIEEYYKHIDDKDM